MIALIFNDTQVKPSDKEWFSKRLALRLSSNFFALFVVALIFIGLNEKIGISFLFSSPLDVPNLILEKVPEKEIPKPNYASVKIKTANKIVNDAEILENENQPNNLQNSTIAAQTPQTMPNIAQNSVNRNGQTNIRGVGEITQQTIWAQECEKIDQEDRPKDCPATNRTRRIIDAVNARPSNPEREMGFSRAEYNARRYAGMREKCEMDNGAMATICIPFGKKPPRVRTPYEICMEQGLGGCSNPPLPNGQQSDPILGFGNQQ